MSDYSNENINMSGKTFDKYEVIGRTYIIDNPGNTDFKILDFLQVGEIVECLKETEAWILIDGGWVKKYHLRKIENSIE